MDKRVSDHASQRIRKRVGIPKKSVDTNARKALEHGITHKEASGRLRRYFEYLFLSKGIGTDIRIYGGFVYIFTKKALITVFPLPNCHKSAVLKLLKRKQAKSV